MRCWLTQIRHFYLGGIVQNCTVSLKLEDPWKGLLIIIHCPKVICYYLQKEDVENDDLIYYKIVKKGEC